MVSATDSGNRAKTCQAYHMAPIGDFKASNRGPANAAAANGRRSRTLDRGRDQSLNRPSQLRHVIAKTDKETSCPESAPLPALSFSASASPWRRLNSLPHQRRQAPLG